MAGPDVRPAASPARSPASRTMPPTPQTSAKAGVAGDQRLRRRSVRRAGSAPWCRCRRPPRPRRRQSARSAATRRACGTMRQHIAAETAQRQHGALGADPFRHARRAAICRAMFPAMNIASKRRNTLLRTAEALRHRPRTGTGGTCSKAAAANTANRSSGAWGGRSRSTEIAPSPSLRHPSGSRGTTASTVSPQSEERRAMPIAKGGQPCVPTSAQRQRADGEAARDDRRNRGP